MKRQTQTKNRIIKELTKVPIVEVACQRAGIGRATYYRWKKEDDDFRYQADEALEQGCLLINDMAESKLINDIKDGRHNAIVFWLRHNHPKYQSPSLRALNHKLNPKDEDINIALVQFVGKAPNDNVPNRNMDLPKPAQ